MSAARLAPLVVDLDGSLTPTDTMVEAIIRVIKRNPLDALRIPLWLLRGRAAFKSSIAERAGLSAASIPYDADVLAFVREEHGRGRRIILATAANVRIASAVSEHLGLFDAVLASRSDHNLKGHAKLAAIRGVVDGPFVYLGDSHADLPIWKAAEGAILVGASPGLREAARAAAPVEREFARTRATLKDWLRALRVHQWLKNLLLFVPALTAFTALDGGKALTLFVAFAAFCCAASATYIANDLWDLDSDRAHPTKRARPFAGARLSILSGVAVAICGLVLAFALAATISPAFLAILALYVVLTSTYSLVLKSYVLVDVIVLSLLYTLRIFAGGIAFGVGISSWLLEFSAFMFLSLALVKRCSELVMLSLAGGRDATRGRDYRVGDLVILWPLGVGAALSSVVVFGLFVSAPETEARYATPFVLWGVAVGLVYWLARLWIKTARGEMPDDPVVYAIKDRGSRITIAAMLVLVLIARFLEVGG